MVRALQVAFRIVVAGVVLFLGGVVFAHATPAVGPVSMRALASSVTSHVGGTSKGLVGCRRVGRGVRRCVVQGLGRPGGVAYRVRMRGYHCWSAEVLVDTSVVGGHLSGNARGCVRIADQVRLLSRF